MYLQLNTRFNPFTYDEMVKPLLYYKQAYDATEAAYSDLATRAEQWKAIAESDDSPMAKAMYQNYSNDLSSVVSDFSSGMTASNRSALLDMRRRYSREIQPIEIAFKRRAQLDDEQRKAMASDPTMLYQRRASEMSLDDFIKNPSLDYGQGYSGAMLTKQVAQAASGMAKEARDSAEGRRKLRALLPYQYELIQQNGFSRDAVMKAIMNSPDADKILTGLVDNAIASSGVLDWGDEGTIARAYDYARQGLWSAIGDTRSQVITDSYGMQSALAGEKAAREAAKKGQEDRGRLYYRTVPKTTVSGDANTRQMESDLRTIQEILKDPSLLSRQSTRTVREPRMINPDPQTNIWIDSGTGPTSQQTFYPYQEKLADLSKRYGQKFTIVDGRLTEGDLEGLGQKIAGDIRSSAVRSFSYKPNITQSDLVSQVLKENTRSYHRRSNSTGLYKLENNKREDQVDIEDINNYFTSDSDIDFDPDLGFIINSTDKDGKTRSAIIDTELFDDQKRSFGNTLESIKIALDNGEDELANALIDATMIAFYKKFNTLEKRQSNTFSKDE